MARFAEKFDESMLGEDIFVFLKTPWVEMVYDEALKRKVWKRTEENYVYALRPHTMIAGSRVACEAYTVFAGRLQCVRTNVLDAITIDEPLNLEEADEGDDDRTAREKRDDYAAYDGLVLAMTKAGVLASESVVIEDALSWQKNANTQKWRKELKSINDLAVGDAEPKTAVA